VSLALLRFLQQYGFKFDAALAAKARRLARRFPAREEAACEAALYLLEKGIDADERLIAGFLALYAPALCAPADGAADGRGSSSGKSGAAGSRAETGDSILGLYAPETLSGAKEGVLTLCNHLVSSERHWITLPFEAGESIRGVLRLLLNVTQKTTEKAEIRAERPGETWYFTLYFTAGTATEAAFFCSGAQQAPEQAEATLQSAFAAAGLQPRMRPRVRYSPDAAPAGLFTEDRALRAVNAKA
jgi:hypothetical protein